MPTRPGNQSKVQSVGRSLDILETLSASDELGLVEIAARTALQPSTAHRLISTLVARGYVVQNPTNGRYLLGFKLIELANVIAKRTERLRMLARPHLDSIQKITGESANLIVLEPPNAVYVDQVEGSRSVRMFARIGAAVPAHTSASGKAIIAFLAPKLLAEILGPEPFPQITPRTITALDVLADELARIRRRGYAIDNEEHEPGVGCVAAPIFNHDGAAVAALSVSAPAPRIYSADPAELGELLMNRADAVSQVLGFNAKAK
jgi:IclR family acetate operon transcriptional repressor